MLVLPAALVWAEGHPTSRARVATRGAHASPVGAQRGRPRLRCPRTRQGAVTATAGGPRAMRSPSGRTRAAAEAAPRPRLEAALDALALALLDVRRLGVRRADRSSRCSTCSATTATRHHDRRGIPAGGVRGSGRARHQRRGRQRLPGRLRELAQPLPRRPAPDAGVRDRRAMPARSGSATYFDKPLAISFWFTRGGDCIPSQDAFDEVASRYAGRVNFLCIERPRRPRDGGRHRA